MESVADMNKKGNSNMVTFATDRPIYLQICDRICNEILQEVYAAGSVNASSSGVTSTDTTSHRKASIAQGGY